MLIEDYGLVSDMHTCALVGRNGSVDWFCVPRFDAGACFAALLGTQENGCWRLAPVARDARAERRYLGETMVLETTWQTATGSVRVLDFMPLRDGSPVLVRIVEGLRGQVAVSSEMRVRFDYGRIVPWVRRVDGSFVALAGADAVWLDGDVPHRGQDMASYADFTVKAGEKVRFVLGWQPSHAGAPAPTDADAALAETLTFWQGWSGRCTYRGPYREAVVRSLLTLKALTYLPTGGIVAAATTSLPEELGGSRNWDYRYCWLRDASFTLQALLRTGYTSEALAWTEWLVRAVAGSPDQIQIMYGVAGEQRLPEIELGWLDGYEGSRPVRIGNEAAAQLQLDVYGEVMDTLGLARRSGLVDSPDTWRLQLNMLEWFELIWAQPDEGLWEIRGEPRAFTHSKLLAWVAFDRAVAAMESGLPGPIDRYRALRDQIHDEVCELALDPRRGIFTQSYGSRQLDAALLLLPQLGFLPPMDPRILATVDAVERELAADGLVRRYLTSDSESGAATDDGVGGGEGTFLVCTFWLVDALALTGRRERAVEVFERLLALRNDLGLLAEQYDPTTGRQLGNMPQAYSHLALVTSALVLADLDPAGRA